MSGKGNANCDGCGSEWDNRSTAPVGSFKANDFGLYDTAGKRPTPQMWSLPVALRAAGWTSSHQNDQNASHSLGISSSVNPA